MAIDTADTAFVLLSAALVLLMTPALAFFYGGLARKKNTLDTMCIVLSRSQLSHCNGSMLDTVWFLGPLLEV